jgi:hypothetical protein
MLDIAVGAEMNLVADPVLIAVSAAREAGNSPNTVMATAASIIGAPVVLSGLSPGQNY